MHFTSLLFVGAAATAANAEEAKPQNRAIHEPRQTQSLDSPSISGECISVVSDIVGSLPTPPPALIEAIGTTGDPCSASIPDSLSDDLSSYEDEFESWYAASSSDVSSALSQCPELSSYESLVPVCVSSLVGEAVIDIVATTTAGGVSSGDSSTGGSDTGSNTASDTGSNSASGAAAKSSSSSKSKSKSSSSHHRTTSTSTTTSVTTSTGSSTTVTSTSTSASTITGTAVAPKETGMLYMALAAAGAIAAAV